MHYCELKDAWGENTISQHYYQENAKKVLENFSPLKPDSSNEKTSKKNNNKEEHPKCDEIITHVMSCPKCRVKLTRLLIPSMISKLGETIDIYREPIVLVLMTLFIIILINMLNNA